MTMKIANNDSPTPDASTIITMVTASEKIEVHILNEISHADIHTKSITMLG